VVLHGGQNALAPLNNGLDPVATGWLQAAVYALAAMLVVLLTRGRLGLPRGWPETGTAHTDNRGHPRVDDDPADRGVVERERSKR
jgi:hypothetical protein